MIQILGFSYLIENAGSGDDDEDDEALKNNCFGSENCKLFSTI
jgi:hypothetical protein